MIYNRFSIILLALCLLGSCAPTVKLEAPDKPIVVNLNVKVKVKQDLEKSFKKNQDVF